MINTTAFNCSARNKFPHCKCIEQVPHIDWILAATVITLVLQFLMVLKAVSGKINYKNLQCVWKADDNDNFNESHV